MTEILELVKELFDWNKKDLEIPKHIAISISGTENWAIKNNLSLEQAYEEAFFNLYKLIKEQIKYKIKALSVLLKPDNINNQEPFEKALSKFLTELEKDKDIEENKVNVTVFGKWYEMPYEIVEPIKSLMEKTEEDKKIFLNLCINYDGKQEIIDACKLIGRKIVSEKLDPQTITEEIFKENLYSSKLYPVKLIIKNRDDNIQTSFLLWHTINSTIYQSDKYWPDFSKNDLLRAIVEYNN